MAIMIPMEMPATELGGRALEDSEDWASAGGAVVTNGGDDDEGRELVGTAVVIGAVVAAALE